MATLDLILGNQRLDDNGKFILDLMTEYNMILLNDDSNCIGTYTRSRNKQKSVIDYILVNQSMYYNIIIQVDEY